jgi:hypothetical protein
MSPADIPQSRDAVERAAALAAAAADTGDPDLRSRVQAELNAALADVEAGAIDLDELVVALAAVAGHAIEEAAGMRTTAAKTVPTPRARDEARAAVLQACVTALRAAESPALSDSWPAEPEEAATDLRSGQDRRGSERRVHPDDSPPARVNRWLYGERRAGADRRTGMPRRRNEAHPRRDEG